MLWFSLACPAQPNQNYFPDFTLTTVVHPRRAVFSCSFLYFLIRLVFLDVNMERNRIILHWFDYVSSWTDFLANILPGAPIKIYSRKTRSLLAQIKNDVKLNGHVEFFTSIRCMIVNLGIARALYRFKLKWRIKLIFQSSKIYWKEKKIFFGKCSDFRRYFISFDSNVFGLKSELKYEHIVKRKSNVKHNIYVGNARRKSCYYRKKSSATLQILSPK